MVYVVVQRQLLTAIKKMLRNVLLFCEHGSGLKLRRYQEEVAIAVVRSVVEEKGLSFVVMFPRQSGKNELQAQIEAYLLCLLQEETAEIVKISPTWKPQSLNAMRRLERVLSKNALTKFSYRKESGYIFRLGKARIFFLSGGGNIVGATASTLLEVDEAQDVSITRYDKDIGPMAASTNATRVFWGTAWTSATLLGRERRAAEKAQKLDGIQRVFVEDADTVAREVPAYGDFVAEQVAKLGRNHPMVRTQYFSEEIDAEAGMFSLARKALMQGSHARQHGPMRDCQYAVLIDVAGEDEAAEETAIGLRNPGRDSTALTIVEVIASRDALIKVPSYKVVDRKQWIGVKHTRLYAEIRAIRDLWNARYLVVDSTGVGAGLASFLGKAWHASDCMVIPFLFNGKTKSDLGWSFLAVIETGRFKDWTSPRPSPKGEGEGLVPRPSPKGEGEEGEGEGLVYDERSEFWRQLDFVRMEVGDSKVIRWSVPDGTRDPGSGDLVHDDLIISAAFCAVLDEVATSAEAKSAVIQPKDALAEMSW
jgi:hypothetical protein